MVCCDIRIAFTVQLALCCRGPVTVQAHVPSKKVTGTWCYIPYIHSFWNVESETHLWICIEMTNWCLLDCKISFYPVNKCIAYGMLGFCVNFKSNCILRDNMCKHFSLEHLLAVSQILAACDNEIDIMHQLQIVMLFCFPFRFPGTQCTKTQSLGGAYSGA